MTRMQAILVAAVWSIAQSTAAAADDGETGSFYGPLRIARSVAVRLSAPGHASGARRVDRAGQLGDRDRARLSEHLGAESRGRALSHQPGADGPARASDRPKCRRSEPCPARTTCSTSRPRTLDVTFHYKLSPNWTAYAIASAITYQGGFLDSTIESSTTLSDSARSAGRRWRATRRHSSTI